MTNLTNTQLNGIGGGYQNVNKTAIKAVKLIAEIKVIKQFNIPIINLKLVLLAIVAFFVHLY